MMWEKMALCVMVVFVGSGLVFGTVATADDHKGDPYPLADCPVMSSALDSMGGPVSLVHEDREIRFCCNACIGRFENDAEAFLAKIDEKIIEDQLAVYPLENCINADVPLGDNAVNFVVNNRLFRTCCNNCATAVKEDAEEFYKKLDAAVAEKQGEDYALDTCPVSGQELGSMGDPVEVVVANRLVKLCCAGCVGGVAKNPVEIIEKVDAAHKG